MVFSLLSGRLSPANGFRLIAGVAGVPGSAAATVIGRLPVAAVPAALVTLTSMVVVPDESAASAAAGIVTLQLPSAPTVAL